MTELLTDMSLLRCSVTKLSSIVLSLSRGDCNIDKDKARYIKIFVSANRHGNDYMGYLEE